MRLSWGLGQGLALNHGGENRRGPAPAGGNDPRSSPPTRPEASGLGTYNLSPRGTSGGFYGDMQALWDISFEVKGRRNCYLDGSTALGRPPPCTPYLVCYDHVRAASRSGQALTTSPPNALSKLASFTLLRGASLSLYDGTGESGAGAFPKGPAGCASRAWIRHGAVSHACANGSTNWLARERRRTANAGHWPGADGAAPPAHAR